MLILLLFGDKGGGGRVPLFVSLQTTGDDEVVAFPLTYNTGLEYFGGVDGKHKLNCRATKRNPVAIYTAVIQPPAFSAHAARSQRDFLHKGKRRP